MSMHGDISIATPCPAPRHCYLQFVGENVNFFVTANVFLGLASEWPVDENSLELGPFRSTYLSQ